MTQAQTGGAIAPTQTVQQEVRGEIASNPRTAIDIGGRGLTLSTLDDVVRFSKYVHASKLACKDDTVESIVVKIAMGLERGVPPMTAIQNIAVINGRPGMFGDLLLAKVMASPAFDHSAFSETMEGEGETYRAVCSARRKGGRLVTREYSVADARVAKLWNKIGPWQTNPSRMLQFRARSFLLRDVFPDVLMGMDITEILREEPELFVNQAEDMQDRIAAGRASVAANRQLPVDPPGDSTAEPEAFTPDAEQTPAPAEPAAPAPTNAPTVKCQKCLAKGQPADGPCGACGDPEPAVARK